MNFRLSIITSLYLSGFKRGFRSKIVAVEYCGEWLVIIEQFICHEDIQAAVEDIERGGSKEAFAKSGHPDLKDWSYRDMWWMTENNDGAFSARGVHGQTIYIDPKAEVVIVRMASHPVAANAANDAYSLPAYQAVADYLMKKK